MRHKPPKPEDLVDARHDVIHKNINKYRVPKVARVKVLMKRSYKYRIYPSNKMTKELNSHLDACRYLYNSMIEKEKDYYKEHKKFIWHYDLCKIVKEYSCIYSQVKQNLAKRLDAALRNVKKGVKSFPRFKGKYHFKSWTYPQKGFKLLEKDKIWLSKIGTCKIKLHRKLPENCKIKTLTVKKEVDKWFIILALVLPNKEVQRTDNKQIGIDLGCKDLITYSDGIKVENPKFLRRSIKILADLQSVRDTTKNRKKKNKLTKKISKISAKVYRQREDFLHKLSRKIVNDNSHIYIEDLKVNQIIQKTKEKKNLRKTILDSGWYSLTQKLTYKVEETGSKLVKVNPRNTTKMCSSCSKLVHKDLSERVHKCICGLILDRDHNAAINILRIGQDSLGLNPKCLNF